MEDQSQKNKSKTSKRIENKINKFIYHILQQQFPSEILVIHLLSIAPSGLSEFDLVRLALMINPEKDNFSEWHNFLNKVITSDKPQQTTPRKEQNQSIIQQSPA